MGQSHWSIDQLFQVESLEVGVVEAEHCTITVDTVLVTQPVLRIGQLGESLTGYKNAAIREVRQLCYFVFTHEMPRCLSST